MAVPFYPIERADPSDKTKSAWYPQTAYYGEVNLKKIADDIAEATSLTHGDVLNAIRGLLVAVPRYALLGYKVRLDDFGMFKLTVSGAGSPAGTKDECDSTHISRRSLRFIPSVELKNAVRDFSVELKAELAPKK